MSRGNGVVKEVALIKKEIKIRKLKWIVDIWFRCDRNVD